MCFSSFSCMLGALFPNMLMFFFLFLYTLMRLIILFPSALTFLFPTLPAWELVHFSLIHFTRYVRYYVSYLYAVYMCRFCSVYQWSILSRWIGFCLSLVSD